MESIICVAVGYRSTQAGIGTEPDDFPRISRYAQGTDYHRLIKDRLHLLLAQITAMVPKTKGRVAVDTAPVLERHGGRVVKNLGDSYMALFQFWNINRFQGASPRLPMIMVP